MDFVVDLNNQIESRFALLHDQTGLATDQLKFLVCSFAAYPLAFVCSLLPNAPVVKHLYCMILGLAFGWITMGTQLIHSFVSSTIAYLILCVFPPKTGAKLVYVWCMLYLSGSHIYRMIVDYMGYTLDFTGPQMLLTLKLTTMAVDYYDGTKKEELKGYAKLMAVNRLPNILEFYGYVYFFAGLLAGPAFNLKEYLDFVDGSLYKDTPNKKMPNPLVPFLKNTAWVLFIAVGVVLNMTYNLTWCRNDGFYYDQYGKETTFFYRLFYVWFAAILARFPYYFAWKLSEGSCIVAGIGYNKTENGVARWDRATNFKLVQLELSQNFREVTDAWNIRTDKWLKHYIYERVTVSPVALTFLNSALWHGFYPGYYFSFLTASIIVQVARVIRRNIRAWFVEADGVTPKKTKPIYDVICTLVTGFTLNYTMTPFVLLGFEISVRLWSSLYFVAHVGTVLVYIVAAFLIRPPKVPKKAQ
eukprot:TRINITY_DN2525_c0_g1_i1.p1 TRINITY_DN2525_c0_g1~~TRINITY_DN2525_c0_g1_i1.p1  ORF type:complete len:471 (+),score=106.65 TRINITY_DN2525_c0_g1_i1:139-1551(+)